MDDMITFLSTGSPLDITGKVSSGGSFLMVIANIIADIDVFNRYVIAFTACIGAVYAPLKVYNIILDNRIKKLKEKSMKDESEESK